MLKIDNNLLVELGLSGLPDAEKNSFLKHIYETLEMRVGIRLADQMSNQQLDEFEQYFEAKDDAGAFKWLETNFPNYKDIVQEEFDKLKAEVAQSAPQILAASQAAAAQAPDQTPTPAAPVGPTPAAAQPPLTDSTVPAQPANPMPTPAPTVPMPPVAPAVPPTPPVGPAGPYQPQPLSPLSQPSPPPLAQPYSPPPLPPADLPNPTSSTQTPPSSSPPTPRL